MPFEKVEDAVAEVMLSTVAFTPLSVVEVPAEVLSSAPPESAMPLDEESPPPATLNPEAVNVEVAVEVLRMLPPTMVNPLEVCKLPVRSPPLKVEVPLARAPVTSRKFARIVEVAVRELPSICREPLMVRVLDAADPPMPTLPDWSTVNAVLVALAEVVVETRKSGKVAEDVPVMESKALGVLVGPTPMSPSAVIFNRVVDA